MEGALTRGRPQAHSGPPAWSRDACSETTKCVQRSQWAGCWSSAWVFLWNLPRPEWTNTEHAHLCPAMLLLVAASVSTLSTWRPPSPVGGPPWARAPDPTFPGSTATFFVQL